jgi:ABC-type nitrate/sulfonate/bicarbonate transport system permease component
MNLSKKKKNFLNLSKIIILICFFFYYPSATLQVKQFSLPAPLQVAQDTSHSKQVDEES